MFITSMFLGALSVLQPAKADAMLSAFEPQAPRGAIVINDLTCSFLDGNGGLAVADSSHTVITPSGNRIVTCKAEGVPNDTGKAVHWNFKNTGSQCFTPSGSTPDWQVTVSPSGNAKLTCIVH